MFLFTGSKKVDRLEESIMSMNESIKRMNDSIERFSVETRLMFQETDKKWQETDKKWQETDKKFQETEKQIAETDKKFRKLEGLFTSQWGKMIEAMVQPAALKLFQDRGIEVREAFQRIEIRRGDLQKEFDMVLINGDVVIVIEVKSTLKTDDVKKHIESLKMFHKYMPAFSDKRVFGAVAYLSCDEHSDKYAYRNGLFVITMTGEDLVEIKNDLNFKPVDFVA